MVYEYMLLNVRIISDIKYIYRDSLDFVAEWVTPGRLWVQISAQRPVVLIEDLIISFSSSRQIPRGYYKLSKYLNLRPMRWILSIYLILPAALWP
jgi:hypothetical protein